MDTVGEGREKREKDEREDMEAEQKRGRLEDKEAGATPEKDSMMKIRIPRHGENTEGQKGSLRSEGACSRSWTKKGRNAVLKVEKQPETPRLETSNNPYPDLLSPQGPAHPTQSHPSPTSGSLFWSKVGPLGLPAVGTRRCCAVVGPLPPSGPIYLSQPLR